MASKIIPVAPNKFASDNGMYEITARKGKRNMAIITIRAIQTGIDAFIKRAGSYTVTSNTLDAFPKYIQEFASKVAPC